eukprot:8780642-Alexandrium_andersonii.AAC.1
MAEQSSEAPDSPTPARTASMTPGMPSTETWLPSNPAYLARSPPCQKPTPTSPKSLLRQERRAQTEHA